MPRTCVIMRLLQEHESHGEKTENQKCVKPESSTSQGIGNYAAASALFIQYKLQKSCKILAYEDLKDVLTIALKCYSNFEQGFNVYIKLKCGVNLQLYKSCGDVKYSCHIQSCIHKSAGCCLNYISSLQANTCLTVLLGFYKGLYPTALYRSRCRCFFTAKCLVQTLNLTAQQRILCPYIQQEKNSSEMQIPTKL